MFIKYEGQYSSDKAMSRRGKLSKDKKKVKRPDTSGQPVKEKWHIKGEVNAELIFFSSENNLQFNTHHTCIWGNLSEHNHAFKLLIDTGELLHNVTCLRSQPKQELTTLA